MIHLDNGGRIIEDVSELPNFGDIRTLYLDFETTSRSAKIASINPWHNCWALGIALTVDQAIGAWYIPLWHHYGNNISRESVIDWLNDIFERCHEWVNHNIKYDAHVAANDFGLLFEKRMVCTLTQAKIIDSDRIYKGGYGLDVLSKDWLGEDISKYEGALQPYLHNNKDYGAIPIDVCGEYACQDVMSNRRIWKFIDGNMPEQCRGVSETEIKLTSVLFDTERNGLRVDPVKLAVKELSIFSRLFEIDGELLAETGRTFRPHVNEDCYDVLCNQYGLPILEWTNEDEDGEPTEKSNPSFGKSALAQYAAHPWAPKRVVELISEYRHLNTLNNVFVRKYQEFHVQGRLHSSYNQAVRTFRMSCKDPNAQQLSPEAKELILPSDGYSIISIDYSQIEFRFIVHYIQDSDAIKAFNENPDTDFHEWVASMCHIPRKPAKTTNFLIAFGGGKNRLVGQLSQVMELVGHLKEQVDHLVSEDKVKKEHELSVFNMMCRNLAEEVYDKYHNTLPGIRRTSKTAATMARTRGYVYNVAGRRRHLPPTKAHIAFNTLNQSSAADLMKERMVATYEACKGTPIRFLAQVHDELVFEAPIEVANDPRVQLDLVCLMESSVFNLRVPIRCAIGVSSENWLKASKSAKPLIYDKKDFGNLEYLK